MVDLRKRKTLAMMGAVSAVVAAPALTSAAARQQPATAPCTAGQCTDIRLELLVAQQPTVRISNDSSHTATVRHIHPGIVHAGTRTFNINSLFTKGPVTIKPGHSITLALQTETTGTIAETDFPRHRYAGLPQQIARLRGVDERGAIVDSTRSFYS